MPLTSYTPLELLTKFQTVRDKINAPEFFNKPVHQKTQELWCAARFGYAYKLHLGDCALHVHEQDEQTDADFYLEMNDNLYPFQITEVLAPNRRRGEEYRKELVKANIEEWDLGTKHGIQWIKNGIKKKFDRYGGQVSDLNLLLYLNFLAYEQEYSEIQNEVSDLSNYFSSV